MFNGIWLVASEPLTMQGREVQAGERFEVSRIHSGALLVTGRAMIAHPQAAPKPEPPAKRRRGRPRKTETPDIEPTAPTEPSEPTAPADEAAAPRTYRRRDLEAEG